MTEDENEVFIHLWEHQCMLWAHWIPASGTEVKERMRLFPLNVWPERDWPVLS